MIQGMPASVRRAVHALFPLLAMTTLVASACGGGAPQLRWSDYDRNCGANTDCTPIAVAQQCECPLCPNVAINAADLTSYTAARAQYDAACKGTQCSNIACVPVTAYCANGTCQVH